MDLFRRLLKNRVAKNAGWLVGSKVVQMILSFFISLLTARYLGPSNYGLINYATAYTTFFSALCSLGLNSIIVKELLDNPDSEGNVLGTAIGMKLVSSICSVLCIIGISILFDHKDSLTVTVVILCNLGLILQVFDTIHYWFQAHLLSKYSAIINLIAYTVLSGYRIFLLATGKGVQWFAIGASVDHLVIAILLLVLYKRKNSSGLSFSGKRAKLMLQKSYHFILSGLMVSIYNSTDRLMLKQMLDETEVGYYSLAVSLCTMWTFVLVAIIDSMTPDILGHFKNGNIDLFKRRNKQLYAIVFYTSIIVSILFCIFGEFAIKILYGDAYLPAVMPLRAITWFVAFSYLGSARGVWIISYGHQRYLKYIYALAAVMNIALNSVFIPLWSGTGAAIASLITQISTSIFLPVLFKPLRPNIKLIIEAITLKNVFEKA